MITAGKGKEDRILSGSYIDLREQERLQEAARPQNSTKAGSDEYLPDFLK